MLYYINNLYQILDSVPRRPPFCTLTDNNENVTSYKFPQLKQLARQTNKLKKKCKTKEKKKTKKQNQSKNKKKKFLSRLVQCP